MTSTSTQTATPAESALNSRAFLDSMPTPTTSKELVSSILSVIDEFARPTMPEGVYLNLTSMLQSFHDKPASGSEKKPHFFFLLKSDEDKLKRSVAKFGKTMDEYNAGWVLLGVTNLINLLSTGSDAIKEQAAKVLCKFVMINTSKALVMLGVLPPLKVLLNSTSDGVKKEALSLTGELTEDASSELVSAGFAPLLIDSLSSASADVPEIAATALFRIMTSGEPELRPRNKTQLLNDGLVQSTMTLLANGTETGRIRATWLLQALVCDERSKHISPFDAIESLVSMLNNGSVEGKSAAACGLQSISLFGYPGVREAIVSAGAVAPLLDLIRNDESFGEPGECDVQPREQAIFTLKELVGVDDVAKQIVDSGCIPMMIPVILSGTLNPDDDPVKSRTVAGFPRCLNVCNPPKTKRWGNRRRPWKFFR